MGLMARPKTTPTLRDPEDNFQRDVRTIFKGVATSKITSGVLLVNQAIATTTTKISHGLGRIPNGFIVVDLTADSRISRDSSVTTDRTLFLHLKATTATTVSLWVF